MGRWKHKLVFHYAVALAAVVLALVLRGLLDPWLGPSARTLTLFGAIAVAVWIGGYGPGLAAAGAGYLGVLFFFIEPRGNLSGALSTPADIARFTGYWVSSLIIIALGGAMHAARKRAEAAERDLKARMNELQASEERFRAFMQHSPVCVYIKDEAGGYVFMNRAAEGLLGLAEGAWKGKADVDLLPADSASAVRTQDRRVLESNAPVRFDLRIAGATGNVEMRSTKFPLQDSSGRRYVGTLATDVTERNRAELALRTAQERLQTIMDTVPTAIVWAGRDSKLRWGNRIYAQWFGLQPEKIPGMPLEEAVGPAAMRAIASHIRRASAGEEVHYERLANLAGLGPRWISAILAPTYAAGEVDGWVAIMSDIHDRKLAEEALRDADRRKDEFLAMLAHELRNPLAPIRNAVAILGRKGGADVELMWSREVIERQVAQMTRLVDDLLDIERISRGKLLVRKERVELERVIDMALETSRPHINAAGHRLAVVMPNEPVALQGDPARLAQLFSNLLNNAAKYTEPRGSISLSAAVEGAQVVVTVEDSGIGFPPEVASRLFRPFSQLAEAVERSRGGLGIGLSMVQGIASLHGGTVTATSQGAGKGSQFTVRLPIASGQAVLQKTEAGESAQPAPGLKVLVTDDNRDAADSLQRILSLYGYEVRVGYDGAAAIELARTFAPRIAVLDIGMPGINGYDAARAIKAEHGARVALVALTGWGQAADRRQAMEAGFDFHLTKPVDPGALNDLLIGVSNNEEKMDRTSAAARLRGGHGG